MNSIMTGPHYNRAWFVHNIMYQVLERLLLTRCLCEVSFENYFISVILKYFSDYARKLIGSATHTTYKNTTER